MDSKSIDALAEWIIKRNYFEELDFSMLEEDSRKKLLIRIGDKFFEKYNRDNYYLGTPNCIKARKAYEKADYKEGLIKVGNYFFGEMNYEQAEQAYEKANYIKGLESLLIHYRNQGSFCRKETERTEGEIEECKKRLIKLGDRAFEDGDLLLALEFYEKAGHKEGITRVQEEHPKGVVKSAGDVSIARDYYKKAGKDDLVKFLEQFL